MGTGPQLMSGSRPTRSIRADRRRAIRRTVRANALPCPRVDLSGIGVRTGVAAVQRPSTNGHSAKRLPR